MKMFKRRNIETQIVLHLTGPLFLYITVLLLPYESWLAALLRHSPFTLPVLQPAAQQMHLSSFDQNMRTLVKTPRAAS